MNRRFVCCNSLITIILVLILTSCSDTANPGTVSSDDSAAKGSYLSDLQFLKQHSRNLIELTSSDSQARIAISADLQGRVMTSTSTGDTGLSYGWINYELLSSGKKLEQFNPVGGEERFWLGPEGGQYSLYFKGGDSFVYKKWQVPALIDTVSYELESSSSSEAIFTKRASITNYSGTQFDLNIRRRISLLDKAAAEAGINAAIPAGLQFVGYQTNNELQNAGKNNWVANRGLISIWLLGMFTPSPNTMVIIPFVPGANSRQMITDDYFGPVPSDRLRITDSVLYFLCDGRKRSKIGIAPSIAKPIAASFDFDNNVLTVVIPQIIKSAPYVNSKWELQKQPYKGDVINSYNDGPLEDGTQMGPFYEIESSSPALSLAAGASASYTQITCHFSGDYEGLRKLAQDLLNVDLNEVRNGLK